MALTDKLTAIANAIRAKTGKTDAMTLDGMASEIEAIETGGGDLDGFIEGTMTELTSGVGTVGSHAFYKCTALTTANFPNATSIGDNAFYGCSALTTADFSNATSIGNNAFYQCRALKNVDFSKVENVKSYGFYGAWNVPLNFPNATSIGQNAFNGCSNAKTAFFPKIVSVPQYAFNGCNVCGSIELSSATSIAAGAVSSCYRLTTLILRSETLCTLTNTSAFTNCYHFHGTVNSSYNPDGLQDGYIYVPSTLVAEYQAATNWSTFADQFRALEDYTVDGTITGELDPEKI